MSWCCVGDSISTIPDNRRPVPEVLRLTVSVNISLFTLPKQHYDFYHDQPHYPLQCTTSCSLQPSLLIVIFCIFIGKMALTQRAKAMGIQIKLLHYSTYLLLPLIESVLHYGEGTGGAQGRVCRVPVKENNAGVVRTSVKQALIEGR